ncbi:SusE domain-containing protein [Flavobacterium sp. F-65]|uniref:SusE domain-containing protein n=1 Tax=Flavobacterium pisciphilum TaxID=2893755 RepID=A0ABS8MUY0_9FLAO|nr:SusE domain-containing protein [Flavobacterium sp. F-65]MCC9071996.1 SusE domain-containing protein [Flavobacterium sp. F-65]
MKNIYIILIAFIGVLAVSCNADDVENRQIVSAVVTPEITAPATGKTFILEVDKGLEEAAKFTWSKAEYSASVVVKYTLLIDKKGGDFTAAKTLATTNNITEVSVLVKELNQAVIDLGAATEVVSLFDVKIASSVSGGVPQVSKTAITISVTPYTGKVNYNFIEWYLVGDATVSGWDNNKGNQILFRNPKNANEYTFTGFFKAGAFKTINTLGAWAPMYGGAGGTLAYRGKDSDPDPAGFVIATEGYYTFVMDVQKLTYKLVPYDATAAKSFTTVGIIGDSTPGGWDVSTAMTKSKFNDHIWSLGITSLKDGGLKFRANDTWDVSWGGNTPFSGGGTGDNIPVSKSKYVIYFNDLDGSYLMIPNQE